MKLQALTATVVGLLLTAQVTLAESPKVDRKVGGDGIPVITIKSEAPKAVKMSEPAVAPQRKAFKVYELEGDTEPKTETKVIVLSSPPPIAPNYNYGFYPWFSPVPYYGGFFPGTFFPTGNSVGFRAGFSQGFVTPPLNYQNPPLNYQNPPVNYLNPPINYQNPPVNYQNPPVNFRPIPGAFYRGGGYCGW